MPFSDFATKQNLANFPGNIAYSLKIFVFAKLLRAVIPFLQIYSLKIFATLFGFIVTGVFTYLQNIIMTEYRVLSKKFVSVLRILHC